MNGSDRIGDRRWCVCAGQRYLSETQKANPMTDQTTKTNDMTEMTELKPCPFCGSTDISTYKDEHISESNRYYYVDMVVCGKCDTRVWATPKEWNTRATPPVPEPPKPPTTKTDQEITATVIGDRTELWAVDTKTAIHQAIYLAREDERSRTTPAAVTDQLTLLRETRRTLLRAKADDFGWVNDALRRIDTLIEIEWERQKQTKS